MQKKIPWNQTIQKCTLSPRFPDYLNLRNNIPFISIITTHDEGYALELNLPGYNYQSWISFAGIGSFCLLQKNVTLITCLRFIA